MAVQDEPCLSHGVKWRCHLQFLLNRLRATVIPVQYTRLFSGLLCECNLKKDKYKQVWNIVSWQDVACSYHRLQDYLHTHTDSGVTNYLKSGSFSKLSLQIPQDSDSCELERNLSSFQVSIFRLFYLLDKAIESNYTFLDGVLTKSGGNLKKQLVTDHETTFQMKGFTKSDIPQLIGRRGVNLRKFIQVNQCQIRLNEGGADFILATVVKRGRENKDVVDKIFTRYLKLAKTIKIVSETFKRDLMSRKKAWYSSRARKANWRAAGNASDVTGQVIVHKLVDGQAFKARREKLYETKVLRHRADYENSKPVKSVLNRGHCLQCLKPFTALREVTPCVHHPGFIVRTREGCYWSCCERLCEDHDQTYESHAKTGCQEARTHNWRVNRKSDTGVQKQAVRKLNTKVPILPSGMDSGEVLDSLQDV